MPLGRPETKYLHTEQGAVGYQVFGEGDRDILFITHWLSNIDMYWDEPSAVRYLDRLAGMGRVILIDKIGSGVSDLSTGDTPVPPIERHLDDILAVLDEVASTSATIIGDTEGGMVAILLAATYPKRFPSLVLVSSFARLSRAEDYPIGAPPHLIERASENWMAQHGTTGDILAFTAPSIADDARFKAWWVRFQRAAQKPRSAALALQWIAATDVRPALDAIQADTLVVHRRDAVHHRLAFGEYLAERIAGARLVVLEGADTLPFHAGPFNEVLDAIEDFLGDSQSPSIGARQFATVLFTDIVGSTAMASEMGDQRWLDLLAEHDRRVGMGIDRHRGELVKPTGDGAMATFDGPYRAIQAAASVVQDLGSLGLTIRAGLHTGEVERRNGEVGGVAIHLASRVMDMAEDGGVMVSSTVRDLLVGSGLEFEPKGTFDLKGIPGEWSLYAVSA